MPYYLWHLGVLLFFKGSNTPQMLYQGRTLFLLVPTIQPYLLFHFASVRRFVRIFFVTLILVLTLQQRDRSCNSVFIDF